MLKECKITFTYSYIFIFRLSGDFLMRHRSPAIALMAGSLAWTLATVPSYILLSIMKAGWFDALEPLKYSKLFILLFQTKIKLIHHTSTRQLPLTPFLSTNIK
jgi:hypothetical protein